MRLQQIRHFLAVVDAGTLRGAAGGLGVTQPAITKSLRQLEEQVGARLLLRTPRGVVLTPAGRKFQDRARVIGRTSDINVPAGSFDNCLKTENTTPLEPDVLEFKYYARGVGLIRRVSDRADTVQELTSYTLPRDDH